MCSAFGYAVLATISYLQKGYAMRFSMFTLATALTGLTLLTLAPVVQAQNLLTNPGFGTGDFTGWTWSGNRGYTGVASSAFGYTPYTGSYFAYFGPIGSDGYLSQTIATTPGVLYDFSTYVAGNGTAPSDFNLSIGGNTLLYVSPIPNQGYTQYNVSAVATSTSTTFTIGFRNDPSYDALGYASVKAVPELSSMLGFGTFAAGGLILLRRRKQARNVA